jgi:hypothetical protein
MLVLDAVVAVAQSDAPEQWAQYCGLVPILVFDDVAAADAPREFLRVRLSGYDATQGTYADRPEHAACLKLVETFKRLFVEALRVGRYRMYEGEAEIDPKLVTVETLGHIRGDVWRLGGRARHNVRVTMTPALPLDDELRVPKDERIRDALRAVHAPYIAAGRVAPHIKRVCKLAQARLLVDGFEAALSRIEGIAKEAEFDAQRGEIGSGKPKSKGASRQG